MHTELSIGKVQKFPIKQTFEEGVELTFLGQILLLIFLVLDVFNQSFAERVDFSSEEFVAGCCHGALGQSAQAVNVKPLHLGHGHVFGPQIDTQGIFMNMVPQSKADRLGVS